MFLAEFFQMELLNINTGLLFKMAVSYQVLLCPFHKYIITRCNIITLCTFLLCVTSVAAKIEEIHQVMS